MRPRRSLRHRVALAFAGLSATLSLLLSAGIWVAAHDVSQRLIDQTLKAELEDYIARRARNPNSLPPATASLRGYLIPADTTDEALPTAIRALPIGQHEIELDAVPYRVAVAERKGDRYLILFSEERQRLREQRFLAYLVGGALLMTLLASVGGWWLAGRAIAPVTNLARAVGAAEPTRPPCLADHHPGDDEIADLARAFDRYLARLAAFLERERAFAADASHELRTPLAVIRGAAEVLTEDVALSETQRGRVARIQRASEDMSDLIGALLLLAREDITPVESPCDAVSIARDCVERHQALAKLRGVTITLKAPGPVSLPAPAAMFAIVIANLVHNAVVHTEHGTVNIDLDAHRLRIRDNGVGIHDSEISHVFQRYYRGAESNGAGIGLSLVKRVCDRHDWQIDLVSTADGTVATLCFAF